MKIDSFLRETAENFKLEVNDGWGNENSLMLQGYGILSKKKENDSFKRVLSNLVSQIEYDKLYAGVASFYVMENGTEEIKERIKAIMNGLKNNLDDVCDEMALLFYMKYETKLGGKEHYQDVYTRFVKAYEKNDKNNAYFMTATIEAIESVDQAVYEYYDGLKVLFKNTMKNYLSDNDEEDLTDKALAAYSILKACRMKVVLAEKYEKLAMTMCDEVLNAPDISDINKGAIVMLIAEKNMH